MRESIKISIVSPVYKAEGIISELVSEIKLGMTGVSENFEIILVDDYSPDESWSKIVSLSQEHDEVKGYKLSRNFGQHAAIKAGLAASTGDAVIVMDCDLQDDPIYIKTLIQQFNEGYDVVYTVKSGRSHSFFKNITASLYNRFFNWLSENKDIKGSNHIGAFSLLSRKVVDAFLSFNDYQFHYLLVLKWMGFRSAYVKIEHRERPIGKSSYGLKRLFDHAMVGIIYQSDKLLRMSIYLGLIVSSLAVCFGMYIVVKSFIQPFQAGWASVMVLILLTLGIILTSIGILGMYIGKMFEQVKNRPQYIIDKET